MPRFNEVINNFINGEVSPRLYGRSDSEVYKRSCRELKNMINFPQGGVTRRTGSEFITDTITGYSSIPREIKQGARIIPFIFSDNKKYLFIFHANSTLVGSERIFHIYDPEEQRLMSTTIAGYSPFDTITSVGASGNTMEDGDLLAEMQYAQNGDTIYFAHKDIPPFYVKKLYTPQGSLSWYARQFYEPYDQSSIYSFFSSSLMSGDKVWRRWPFTDLNKTDVTLSVSATTGSGVVVTASTSGTFTSGLVGSLFYITANGILGVGVFTGYASASQMTCTVLKTFPGTSTYTTWGLSAWSYSAGYPRAVTFLDGRLIWGFTKIEPQKVWFSQAGDLFELSNTRTLIPGNTIDESDPGNFLIASTEVNDGQWLVGGQGELLMGTKGREYLIRGISGTLENIQVRPQTAYGSENVQPCIVDDTPIFVQRGSRKLRQMTYDDRIQGYTASDILFFAEHMPRISQRELGDEYVSKIKQLAYQALPNNLLWVLDSNGYLFCCTKDKENNVTAFHRHELGGSFVVDGVEQFPRVQSICSLPSADGVGDDLYLLVERTINGSNVMHLERISKEFVGYELHADVDTRENMPLFSDNSKMFRVSSPNFWAPLTADANAVVYGGSATGTLTGSVTYDKYARFTAGNAYISWDGTSNADFAQQGCIRFTLTAFNWAMFVNRTLVCISKAAGDAANMIKLYIDTSGNMLLTINDSTGAAIINGVTLDNFFEYVSQALDVEIELNYDLTNGATRVFVGGVQFGSTITTTGTRTNAIDLIRINAEETGTDSCINIAYSNLMIFNTVQHTEDYEVFDACAFLDTDGTIMGLDHLEGESVVVLADGNYLGAFTVTGGEITLGRDDYSTLLVGLPYTHKLEIQPIDSGTGIGSAMGSIKRIDRAVVRFERTAAASIGPDETTQEELVFRVSSTPMDSPIELVTDDKVVEFNGDYDRQARIVVMGDKPLPCTVTCLSLRGITNDV